VGHSGSVPDDPGPHPRLSRRALWVAPLTVLGLVAVLIVAIRAPVVSHRPSVAPSSSVVTAPTTSAAAGADPFTQIRPGPELDPVGPPSRTCLNRARVVRVLQFNIHFGISREGVVDPGTIAAEIRSVRPDLVSLNEVDAGTLRTGRLDEAAYLARATGLHAVYGPNLPWEGGLFGNAILTRYQVEDTQNLALPVISGLEPRGLLTVTVRVGGRTVSFSSTHLSDGDDGRVSRGLQAQEIATVVRQSSAPTIVAGDLNSEPSDLPVRILRQDLLDSQEEGGRGRGDTVPEPDPQGRIDYVLHDRSFAVVPGSTRVLPSASSDHRAVVTDLALLPRGCVG
jgi:endonuclease/exonuclease/phosphatase family metal-dependent hydrolase